MMRVFGETGDKGKVNEMFQLYVTVLINILCPVIFLAFFQL